MECIVLAGGLGTRLRSAIGDMPKCMASVAGHPFLHYVFSYLERQGCTRVILSLGYMHEHILHWVAQQQVPFMVDHVLEHQPLGTGGGIRLAMQQASEDNVVVLNGDTLFDVSLSSLLAFHKNANAETTLALKRMEQFDRYGSVVVDSNGVISSFQEKQYQESGLINGGVYIVNREGFITRPLPDRFSFEKDYLEAFVAEGLFCAQVHESYFIDIGVPSDYLQAQDDFKRMYR